MQPELFETGSGGFVWKNIALDDIFSHLQLHVYTAQDMRIGQEWQGSQFANHYDRVYFVKEGSGVLHFKDFTLQLKPMHLYLIPPYQLISHQADSNIHFYWAHFQCRVDRAIDLFMLYGHPAEINCGTFQNIERDFLSLVSLADNTKPSAMLERNRLLLSLIYPFMRLFEEEGGNINKIKHQNLLRSLQLISSNIANPPTLKALASAANMTPEHFSRKFKAAFNVSPKRYILHKRIATAKQQLLLNSAPLKQIAENCGFYDIFHFSRSFKKETGYSPTEFKQHYNLDKTT